jgi:hypothetical protein
MNRYGTVMPSVGKILPKESIDDEVHLDLTVGAKKTSRPIPLYDPKLAGGFKPVTNGHVNGNGANGHNGHVHDHDTERERVH